MKILKSSLALSVIVSLLLTMPAFSACYIIYTTSVNCSPGDEDPTDVNDCVGLETTPAKTRECSAIDESEMGRDHGGSGCNHDEVETTATYTEYAHDYKKDTGEFYCDVTSKLRTWPADGSYCEQATLGGMMCWGYAGD